MAHRRTEIRKALKQMLIGSDPENPATSAGLNVFTNRAYNLDRIKLPAINIYDESESAEAHDLRGRLSRRRVLMKIDVLVSASSDYDEDLDDIVLEIENIIKSDITLKGTANGIVYQSTELAFEAGEKTIGRATLTYEISYIG